MRGGTGNGGGNAVARIVLLETFDWKDGWKEGPSSPKKEEDKNRGELE